MNENKIEVIDKTGAIKIYIYNRPDGKFGIVITRGTGETFEAMEFDNFFDTIEEVQKKVEKIMREFEKKHKGKFIQENFESCS